MSIRTSDAHPSSKSVVLAQIVFMLLTNGHIATLRSNDSFGLIEQGAIALDGDRIAWVGVGADVPAAYQSLPTQNFQGRLVTPALIDCHTHVVFGGNRAADFEHRLNGASYEHVAKAGGGIVSTVMATRAGAQGALLADALSRVDAMIAEGLSLIEVKSGYGLDRDAELKMLGVARQIAKARPIDVRTSFLGAHAARALGEVRRGRTIAGHRVDLNIWDTAHPSELSCRIGFNPLHSRIFGGSL